MNLPANMGDPYEDYVYCRRRLKRSWFCSRRDGHTGPCALVPRWWNFTAPARRYRKRRHL